MHGLGLGSRFNPWFEHITGTYFKETVMRFRLRLLLISLFILVLPCPRLASLTDRLQKIEASKSGIEELLKRVMDWRRNSARKKATKLDRSPECSLGCRLPCLLMLASPKFVSLI